MTLRCPSATELEQQLERQFTGAEAAALESHLAGCAACRQVLDRLTSPPRAGVSPPHGDETRAHDFDWQAHQSTLHDAVVLHLRNGHSAPFPLPVTPVIPGYRVDSWLGEGGAGVVYRARHEKLERYVALKIIRPGTLDLATGRARFRREAEVLSRLHHTHIVQLFDFGEIGPTPSAAAPYMVLELVEGGTLSEKVNHRPVPPRTAAALVEILARALHAVHQKGIVHRDLKPGNILLQPVAGFAGAEPLADPGELLARYVPKITDFGLAKQMSAEQSRWTQTGDVVGTPAYMAPEQSTVGDAVTHATDIYSLGVILYELLTGMPPFRARDWVELVIQVKECEPVAPSRLLPGIPRDIETICLKCLYKDPARRYPSAEALADDLRRFLDDKTIVARPTGRAEKVGKWCRRNPWVAGLSAAVLTLLVAGLAITTWLTLLANHHRDQTHKALEQFQEEQGRTERALAAEQRRRGQARQALEAITSEMVPDWLARGAELTPEQRQFLTRALALYQDFARDIATDESSRADVADAQLRVAQFQRSLIQRLEDRIEARNNAEQAQQKWEELVREFPAKPEYGRRLALAYWTASVLQRETGQIKEAEESVRAAVTLNRRLLADFGADPATEHQLCDCLNTLGTILQANRHLKEAEAQFRVLVPMRQELLKRFPHKVDHGIGLIWAHLNLALVAKDMSQLEEADRRIQEAQAIAIPLAAKHNSDALSRRWLGRCREVRGEILLMMGQPAKAELEYRAAVTVLDGVHRDFPSRRDIQSLLLRNRRILCNILSRLGKFSDAEKELRQFLAILDPQANNPKVAPFRQELAGIMVNVAQTLIRQNQRQEARRCLEEAEPYHREALAVDPRNAGYRLCYRNNRAILAECLVDLGEHAAAARTVEQWLQLSADYRIDKFNAATCLARCAAMVQKDQKLSDTDRRQLAQKYSDRAFELLKEVTTRGFTSFFNSNS